MNDANTALADSTFGGHTSDHEGAVASLIANYKPIMIPRARWASIAEFTRSAVTDFHPRHEDEARLVLFGIARVTDWTHHTAGHPLRREIVLDPRNIDDYIKRGYPVAELSRKTSVRNYLHMLSAELGYGDETRRRARPTKTVDRYAPYTPREYTDFRLTGRTASTDRRQHIWSTVLAVGAGFGVTTPELFEIAPDDFVEDERGLVLHVRGRTVICLPEWERDVAAVVARRALSDSLLSDFMPSDPATYLHNTLNYTANTFSQNRYVVERLRTTWIVRHLEAGTPAQAIMRALGVSTTKPIERCLRYVEPLGDNDYYAALQLGGDR
jgi:hypothetical protein